MSGKYDKIILKTAREHFAQAGFFGARIDVIAENANVNRKLIYDFCRTKDQLYMTVLSDVSREITDYFNDHVDILTGSVRDIYGMLFGMLENFGDFLRLWAWERLSPTIHGPRILETANFIFEQTRSLILERIRNGGLPKVSPDAFETIEALCHGCLLACAMYFRCDPETGRAQEESAGRNGCPALKRLNMSMKIQSIMLSGIEQILCDTESLS